MAVKKEKMGFLYSLSQVDQTKTQTNTESSVDSPNNILINKDATSERRPGGQLAGM